jgi:hypothetical protein
VSETGRCPYCGSVPGATGAHAAPEPDGPARAGLEPLYREMRRIREIAEANAADNARRIIEARAADDDARRIADLTRQVHELRATVARLRGPGMAARPVPASVRAARTDAGCRSHSPADTTVPAHGPPAPGAGNRIQ